MTINEYQALAMRTLNPALSRREVLINSVMGLCGESGEANIDKLKKRYPEGFDTERSMVRPEGDL